MATRFWVGGTGTWDNATTTHWASSTGGAGGVSVPGSNDTVTFDGASGGGTVTVNFGGTITVQSITCGAFTGTLDFSVNNNSVTLSAAAAFNGSGTGTRTIKLGSGTWTISSIAAGTPWNLATTTGLTFDAGTSVIDFTGAASAAQTFSGGGLTYAKFRISGARLGITTSISGGGTITTLSTSAACVVSLPSTMNITNLLATAQLVLYITATVNITNAPTLSGTQIAQHGLFSGSGTGAGGLSIASGTMLGTWCAIAGIAFSGGATFTFNKSNDLGRNTGATITPPKYISRSYGDYLGAAA